MKKLILIILFFLSIILFGRERKTVPLTQKEKDWVKSVKNNNDTISIYLDSDLGILNYYAQNEYRGIYSNIIYILQDSTGLNFEIKTINKNSFKKAINSQIPDIIMGVEDYKWNNNKYNYLENKITLEGVFLTRKNYPITDFNTDLSNKKIVYVKDNQIINKIINKYGKKVILIPKSNSQAAVQSLISEEADIYAEDLDESLRYLVKNNIAEIKLNYLSTPLKTDYYIGGLKKYDPLLNIIGRISKTIELDKVDMYKEILDYTKHNLKISKDIQKFLGNNKTLKIYIPDNIDTYPLYYRSNSGKEAGFLFDYFSEIKKIFDVEIVFENSKSRKGFHIFPFILSINGENSKSNKLLTTDPYLEFQLYIFNKKENNFVYNLNSLKKYKIAVKKGSLEESYLLKNGFKKNIVIFNTEEEVMNSLDKKDADIILGGIKKTYYLLDKYNIKNVKVAGVIPDKIGLQFGIPKNNEILYFLINLYTKDFKPLIEYRKNKFLEKKVEITKDFKTSIIITLISLLVFFAGYIHFKKLKKLYSKLTDITLGMVETLENANTYNDEDTGDHVKRINRYSELIAYEMKLSNKFVKEIGLYASLHDIGKIGISDAILKKPGKLTDEEFDTMKKHVEIGYNIIKDLEVSEVALNIIRYHHEKWNGNGYRKLKGTEIPLEARIVALADVYDALRQERVYKKPFTHEKSLSIIKSESGKHFDPDLVRIFLKNHNKFKKIFDNKKIN